MRVLEYTIGDDFDGKKLYTFLKGGLHASARTVTKLRHSEDGLKINGVHARTVDILKKGDRVTVALPEIASDIPATHFDDLRIVYEDEDIMVVNKPPFLAMHPTHNHQGDTLANEVAAYFLSKGENIPFRAVGRLDKCTSGLVILALNRHAASIMSANYEKTYIAIADGEYHGSGTIDRPVFRPDPGKTLRAVGESGERAVTHWTAEVSNGQMSILRVTLETGRTHQIRVHFLSLGTPLAGDEMYGSKNTLIGRAALHCAEVEFTHPVTNEKMHFSVPLPEDMQRLADIIRQNAASESK